MRLKFLLRPGWLGLIVLVVAFATLCFTLLAPWQFSRNDETQVRNDAIAKSFNAPPRPLGEVLEPNQAPDVHTEWSEVTFSGRYLPEDERLAWQRTVQGEPAFEVLTPFRLDDGTTLLVNRGYVRPVEGTQAPSIDPPPRGEVTVTTRVRADEHDSEQRPAFAHDGHRWVYAINSGVVAEDTGNELRPGYFTLTAEEPGVLSPLPLPRLESGPYFSYALQWIAFGAMAIIAIGYLIYTEVLTGSSRSDGSPRPPRSKKRSVAQAIAEEERQEREAAAEPPHATTGSTRDSDPE